MRGSPAGKGLFDFWLRFGSVTGGNEHAPSPKPRQKSKILLPHRYIISVNALASAVSAAVHTFEARAGGTLARDVERIFQYRSEALGKRFAKSSGSPPPPALGFGQKDPSPQGFGASRQHFWKRSN
jgi:hypothetical protein